MKASCDSPEVQRGPGIGTVVFPVLQVGARDIRPAGVVRSAPTRRYRGGRVYRQGRRARLARRLVLVVDVERDVDRVVAPIAVVGLHRHLVTAVRLVAVSLAGFGLDLTGAGLDVELRGIGSLERVRQVVAVVVRRGHLVADVRRRRDGRVADGLVETAGRRLGGEFRRVVGLSLCGRRGKHGGEGEDQQRAGNPRGRRPARNPARHSRNSPASASLSPFSNRHAIFSTPVARGYVYDHVVFTAHIFKTARHSHGEKTKCVMYIEIHIRIPYDSACKKASSGAFQRGWNNNRKNTPGVPLNSRGFQKL